MFVTAYSLPEEDLAANMILRQVQATTDASSILCGLIFFFSCCLGEDGVFNAQRKC